MKTGEWDSEAWLEHFGAASRLRDAARLRALRRDVFQTTVEAVKARGSRLGSGVVGLDPGDHYDALHRGTVFYESTEALAVAPERRGRFSTEVSVVNGECLEAARALGEQGRCPGREPISERAIRSVQRAVWE